MRIINMIWKACENGKRGIVRRTTNPLNVVSGNAGVKVGFKYTNQAYNQDFGNWFKLRERTDKNPSRKTEQ